MADQKKYLRATLAECRASLTPEFARSSSLAIQRRLLAADFYRTATAVVLYSSTQNEVATDLIAADAFKSGKEVFFPRIDRARDAIVVARVRDLAELTSGAFGISEPSANAPVIAPEHLASAVVTNPGMAFGPQGQRLGRGGGHYDRFLAMLPKEAITVGLAYSFQLLDGIPEESFDQRLNYIITEYALIRGSHAVAREARPEANRGGTPGWF